MGQRYGGAVALSNANGGSWQLYREITITNSGGTLTDYQILVQLSGTNFPVNALSDGADVRFTDANGNELSYWIENWYFSGKTANVWVKVTSIPAGATTIHMYYGNPNANSASNGAKTFEFFDDFDSLGWQTFWNASTPQVSTLDGKSVVTITGWGEIVSPLSLQSPNYAFAKRICLFLVLDHLTEQVMKTMRINSDIMSMEALSWTIYA